MGEDSVEGQGATPRDVGHTLEWVLRQLRRQLVGAVEGFPDPALAGPEGLIVLTREITPELVLEAYGKGIFPMAEPDGVIGWWSPDPRTVLDLDRVHIGRRLARTIRQGRFEIRRDTVCKEVIAACADRKETWISPRFQEVYLELHTRGNVHSVETWREGKLVGGLYGVSLGGAFMAESMFHRQTDASKAAVVGLIDHMRAQGMTLLDIQFETKATAVFRPVKLARREYLRRLEQAQAPGAMGF